MNRARAHVSQIPYIPRNGQETDKGLPKSYQDAFPYLEKIAVTAEKNPYTMLTIIVSIASVIVIAVTTLSISVIGSVFIMYGKMNSMEAQQTVIIEKLGTNEQELKVLRTYEASVLSRQNYIAGLMDGKRKQQLNEYDRANPIPRIPDKPIKEK